LIGGFWRQFDDCSTQYVQVSVRVAGSHAVLLQIVAEQSRDVLQRNPLAAKAGRKRVSQVPSAQVKDSGVLARFLEPLAATLKLQARRLADDRPHFPASLRFVHRLGNQRTPNPDPHQTI
jgi:hypothetical protein